MKLEIIIPSAGLGRRMRSYGPKALVLINGETLINRQIRLLSVAYPEANFIVVAGYEAAKLKKALPARVRVVLNKEFETTNVAKSIELGLKHTSVKNHALIVYGDLVFNLATVADLPLGQSGLLVENTGERKEEVGVTSWDDVVVHMSYGLPTKWAHICLLTPKDKKTFLSIMKDATRAKCFGYEVLNKLIASGSELAVITSAKGRLVEVDCSKDVPRAEQVGI